MNDSLLRLALEVEAISKKLAWTFDPQELLHQWKTLGPKKGIPSWGDLHIPAKQGG